MNIQLTSTNDILERLTEYLDIPDAYVERAQSRYESVGRWLGREESKVSDFGPNIFPQGSFSLGTAIRPVSDEDDYDVDLVCKIQLSKSAISQKQLKELIGNELVEYVDTYHMASPAQEYRRSWRLDYADQDVSFHLDVLPAIPALDFSIEESIAITDNQLNNYSIISSEWPQSNPVDYLKWFRERMEIQYQAMLKTFAESREVNIEDVPEYKIKTPLQRSIQILKRHRDITYDGDPDDKPISILITTLAARAYSNESNLSEALLNIVLRMREFIEDRDGIDWVPNPVNEQENFADKWEQYPKRRDAFFDWLDRIETDVVFLLSANDISALKKRIITNFGETAGKTVTQNVSSNEYFFEASKTKSTAIVDLSKFAVLHKERPSWSMVLDSEVQIIAEVIRDGSRPKKFSSGTPLNKYSSLRFTALTSVKKPYEVYWQVVNTGQEATDANQLRGDFYMSSIRKGRKVRKESTKYRGMHWIECFIVKQGVCVARSGEFVVNIS